MRSFIVTLFIVTLSSVSSHSQIQSFRNDNIRIESLLDLKTATITIKEYAYTDSIYRCTTVSKGFDLFIVDEDRITGIYHPHKNTRIGTKRPFFLAKRELRDYDLSLGKLKDTSTFIRFDTIPNDTDSNSGLAASCHLPHFHFSKYLNQSILTLVVQNSEKKYVIVDMYPIGTIIDGSFYLSGFRINWYLQNNGTLDFTGINRVVTKKVEQAPKVNIANHSTDIYSIQGRKLNISTVNGSSVVISSDGASGLRKVFMNRQVK